MAKKAQVKKKPAKKKSKAKKAPARKKSPSKKKAPKRTSAKKSPATPVPPAVDRGFPDLIESQPNEIQLVARRLRALVIETLSDVVESVVGSETAGLAIYKRSGKSDVLCGIKPVGDACLLYVQNIQQEDGDTLQLRGDGKNSRHVRFESLVEVAHADVRNLLQRLDAPPNP